MSPFVSGSNPNLDMRDENQKNEECGKHRHLCAVTTNTPAFSMETAWAAAFMKPLDRAAG